jgi:hypothetical protein
VLTIRNAQMSTFETARLEEVAAKVLQLLIRRYDYRIAVPPEMASRITGQCRTAWRYGLRSPSSIGDFVDLGLQLGTDFHAHDAVRAVLTDPAIPAEERMRALAQQLQPIDWIQIRAWLTPDFAA